MFCYGVDNVPNLTKVLEVLEIKSTNGCDFANIYDAQDLSSKVHEFQLATMAVDLHKYYFHYIVSYLVNIYVFFVFPEIEMA